MFTKIVFLEKLRWCVTSLGLKKGNNNCHIPIPQTDEEDATNTKRTGKQPHEHKQKRSMLKLKS